MISATGKPSLNFPSAPKHVSLVDRKVSALSPPNGAPRLDQEESNTPVGIDDLSRRVDAWDLLCRKRLLRRDAGRASHDPFLDRTGGHLS